MEPIGVLIGVLFILVLITDLNIITAVMLGIIGMVIIDTSTDDRDDAIKKVGVVIEQIVNPVSEFRLWSIKYADYNHDHTITDEEFVMFKSQFMKLNELHTIGDNEIFYQDGVRLSDNQLLSAMDYWERMR